MQFKVNNLKFLKPRTQPSQNNQIKHMGAQFNRSKQMPVTLDDASTYGRCK